MDIPDEEQIEVKKQYFPKSFEADDTVTLDDFEEGSYFDEDDTY